ncbi:MAG: S4 domain-containing protein, partial [Patescibacteria group bacterium]|nr:S4 domain-containing protein [Patescibacteria group bacterium]
FAPTRNSARQLVNHGHILVNGEKVTIPSYQLKIGDEVSFSSEKATKISYIKKSLDNKDLIIPFWLERKNNIGRLISLPNSEEISKQVNLRLVIEYYSK